MFESSDIMYPFLRHLDRHKSTFMLIPDIWTQHIAQKYFSKATYAYRLAYLKHQDEAINSMSSDDSYDLYAMVYQSFLRVIDTGIEAKGVTVYDNSRWSFKESSQGTKPLVYSGFEFIYPENTLILLLQPWTLFDDLSLDSYKSSDFK